MNLVRLLLDAVHASICNSKCAHLRSHARILSLHTGYLCPTLGQYFSSWASGCFTASKQTNSEFAVRSRMLASPQNIHLVECVHVLQNQCVCVCGCRVEDAALGICSNSSRAFSTCLLSTLVIDLLCVCRRWYEKQATLHQVTLAFQPFMREASMLFMLLLGLGLDPWAKFDQARHMYAHPFTTHFLLSSLMEYALYIAGCGIINSYTTECVAYIWLSL